MSDGLLNGSFTTYGIVDPRTSRFVYVGKTSDFAERRRAHLGPATSKRESANQSDGSLQSWLHQAIESGVLPCFVVLEVVQTWRDVLRSEGDWLRVLSTNHDLLLNSSENKELYYGAGNGSGLSAESRSHIAVPVSHSASTLAASHDQGKAPRHKAANHGEAWTKALDHEVTAYFQSGAGANSISASMGRSSGSIRARLVKLGLILDRRDLKA